MNIFLGLIGVQEFFFHLIFACANFFFCTSPAPPAPISSLMVRPLELTDAMWVGDTNIVS